MKNVTMIAAVGKNLELGKNNQLIWPLKKDLRFFRDNTIYKPIVMGMNTFLSLPKLLPKRKHIVLTRKNVTLDDEIIVVHSMEELLLFIEDYPDEVMIIGGAKVYQEMLPYSSKLVLTEIDAEEKDADAFFPNFSKEEWDSYLIDSNVEDNISYSHKVYTKK